MYLRFALLLNRCGSSNLSEQKKHLFRIHHGFDKRSSVVVQICPRICFCGETISKNAFRRFESVYRPDSLGRIFAFGESSRALRLASELADLRAGNPNRRRFAARTKVGAIPASRKGTPMACLFCWLGWPDSNRRMPESKSGALPLGDIPMKYPYIVPQFSRFVNNYLQRRRKTFSEFSQFSENPLTKLRNRCIIQTVEQSFK